METWEIGCMHPGDQRPAHEYAFGTLEYSSLSILKVPRNRFTTGIQQVQSDVQTANHMP